MKYLHALNKIGGVGPRKMRLLLDFFETPQNAWEASESALKNSGVGEKLAEKIILERKNIDPDRSWEYLEKENIRFITLDDSAYPKLLKNISNPPYIIYARGEMDFNSSPTIAVVGSRKLRHTETKLQKNYPGNSQQADFR